MVRQNGKRAALVLTAVALLSLPCGAMAQTPISGFGGMSGANSKKPIDIESDRLEVDDQKHIAIFTGNVLAVQGDYNLRSQRLEVTYDKAPDADSQGSQQASKVAKPSPVKAANAGANAPTDPLSSGQIKFVHALGGKVVVTSKVDEQEATGDDVVYDVKAQKIVMTGKEVILTQKRNVVKGKQIEIDLATGRATVIPENGRVRAVLVQDDAKALTAAQPGGSAKKKEAAPSDAPKSQPPTNWQPQDH